MVYTCFEIANYMLKQSAFDDESITNLRLQKLVFYAQAYSLAINDKPLFNEEIQAWRSGPVICELFNKYSSYDNRPIPEDKHFDTEIFSKEALELLTLVYTSYRQYSGWGLRAMTCNERPWLDSTCHGTSFENTPISHDAMRSFYKQNVKEADAFGSAN